MDVGERTWDCCLHPRRFSHHCSAKTAKFLRAWGAILQGEDLTLSGVPVAETLASQQRTRFPDAQGPPWSREPPSPANDQIARTSSHGFMKEIPNRGSETLDGDVSGDNDEEEGPQEETDGFMKDLDELYRDKEFVAMVELILGMENQSPQSGSEHGETFQADIQQTPESSSDDVAVSDSTGSLAAVVLNGQHTKTPAQDIGWAPPWAPESPPATPAPSPRPGSAQSGSLRKLSIRLHRIDEVETVTRPGDLKTLLKWQTSNTCSTTRRGGSRYCRALQYKNGTESRLLEEYMQGLDNAQGAKERFVTQARGETMTSEAPRARLWRRGKRISPETLHQWRTTALWNEEAELSEITASSDTPGLHTPKSTRQPRRYPVEDDAVAEESPVPPRKRRKCQTDDERKEHYEENGSSPRKRSRGLDLLEENGDIVKVNGVNVTFQSPVRKQSLTFSPTKRSRRGMVDGEGDGGIARKPNPDREKGREQRVTEAGGGGGATREPKMGREGAAEVSERGQRFPLGGAKIIHWEETLGGLRELSIPIWRTHFGASIELYC